MLPGLTARALASLRRTCEFLQDLIDTAHVSALKHTTADLLPLQLWAHADSSLKLQEMLTKQGQVLWELRAGLPGTIKRLPMPAEAHASSISWSPEWPSLTIVVVMTTSRYLTSTGSHGHESEPASLTSPFHILDADSLLPWAVSGDVVGDIEVVDWVWWHKTLVFCSLRAVSRQQLGVLNAYSGVLLMQTFAPECHWASPEGLLVVTPEPEGPLLMVILLPVCAIQAMIYPPALSVARQAASSSAGPELCRGWLEISPDGRLLAVACCCEEGPDEGAVQALSIYSTFTGEELGMVKYLLCLAEHAIARRDPYNHRLYYDTMEPVSSWNSTITYLLVQSPHWRKSAVMSPDGLLQFLESVVANTNHRMGWSQCGRYVDVTESCLLVDNDDNDEEDIIDTLGYIWDTQAQRRVFSWQKQLSDLWDNKVVWSTLPRTCFVQACNTFVFLDANDTADQTAPLTVRPCDGPSEPAPYQQSLTYSFSPNGKLLVTSWRMPPPRGVFSCPAPRLT